MSYYLEGYADQLSYRPGESVGIHLSTNSPSYSLAIHRLGGRRSEPVYAANDLAGSIAAAPENASTHGCNWPAALPPVPISPTWPSGVYAVMSRLADGSMGEPILFVVRAAQRGKHARFLLQLTTNTHNAYNSWGGHCFYPPPLSEAQVSRVSFQRPGAWGRFGDWELPFISWAEHAGYALDYAVNTDLEMHPDVLDGCRLFVSVGHDEYWSATMRDRLETFIAAGGNAAFFSGNSVCWQVRTADRGQALVCWKERFAEDPYYHPERPDHPDHRFLTALWSHPFVNRPENALTGVGVRLGGYDVPGRAAFTVDRPDHWAFAGTGLTAGAAFGRDHPDVQHRIVGYECDGCEWVERDGRPMPTCRDGTPEGFTILAHAPAAWKGGWANYPGPDRPRAEGGSAVLGTYTRNGTVFTVGTVGWANGLRDHDPVVERITSNVLDRLSGS